MPDDTVDTIQLHRWLARLRQGDLSVRNELIIGVQDRLERLARKMLQGFPGVHRWADTGDVLQAALMRLLRSLEEVQPASMNDFFGLAAEQMRRELLDLARHFFGPMGSAAHHSSQVQKSPASSSALDQAAPNEENEELEKWCRFHQEVEHLPVEEREVVGLIFYHGWTQADVAEFLHISDRTVRRRWEGALVKLHQTLREKG